MTDSKAYSNDLLASRLKDLLNNEMGDSDIRWSYREAASVLSFFDMNSLKPVDGIEPNKQEALQSLEADSWLVPDATRKLQWTLRADSRKAALKRLKTEDNIKKALEANPDRPQDPLQLTFESYVFHKAQPLETQSPQQLFDTLQVAEWLKGLVEGVPDPAVVRQKIENESLLAPFRFLVGDHFRGREAELRRLSDYVGTTEASGVGDILARGFNYVFSIREKLPLFIYGPGGVGKSTLLAKFILDNVSFFKNPQPSGTQPKLVGSQDGRFPFAYLDFDRPSLIAEEPITLLLEALRQLEIQFPESRVSLSRLRESWLQRITSRSPRKREEAELGSPPANFRIEGRSLFFDEFAEEVKLLTPEDKPFLLVLDTFEEVQYRSSAFVDEVFSFLDDLQKRIPTLRTVLSGRAPVQSPNFKTDDLPLAKFDVEVAQGFLMSHGIEDPALARRVAEQVGGNPLTLKLAVELLRREAPDSSGIRDLKVPGFFRKLEDEAIQAQLFTRILEHIHDPEVAKLAHPGLALRRITPELILKVLAGPCGVEVKNLDEAKVLFEKLSREVALVTQISTDVIIHRPDLRSVMLEPLTKDKPDEVAKIHQAAIDYYQQFDDDISRAEEIYHRLSLDFEREVLKSRWRDGVRQYLGSAIEELPMRGRGFLAVRLRLEVDEAVWTAADLEDWEAHAERRARDLLELKQPLPALAAIRQRSERTSASPLPSIEREVVIAALASIQSFFSVYQTERIKRASMSKAYQALANAVRELEIRPETMQGIRKDLSLQDLGGTK